MPALAELEQAWLAARDDAAYRAELDVLLRDFVGRPTPLYLAERLSEAGRARGLYSSARTSTTPARTRSTTRSARRCSPGGWASRGSSPRPAPASTASRPRPPARCSDLECVVYMGAEDIRRQQPNVQRMELLGATVSAGRRRRAHAEGGVLGGDPRLGHQRRRHPLRHRLGRRPGALSRRSCATCSA